MNHEADALGDLQDSRRQKKTERAWVTDHLKEPLDNPEMTVS